MRGKTDRWRRVDELFAGALEREGVALELYLDEECAGDAALRAEVESMLRFARQAENFLETPVMLDAMHDATEVWPDAAPSLTAQPRQAIDNSRFIPGDVVAGRYRIVGLLGRGGMGEVYRADDLKLAQPVALKFLAESLSSNGAALARFHREVSVARQISHRHVCRVYDIGEHAGMHFLSMEYVRGEELSSLLKRIGRLPLDKALETARQLCAGLAAIHAAGVLHRDLKPANVMIDEHGDVRITDFGVAALAEGVSGREAMIGTPVYMSPEQLSGGELTTRSDLYALGLVLYEAFTGNRPFAATSLAEIVRDRLGETAPTSPSSWITDLDPLVERVILRCLEKDPQRRPTSALQVAAALPGGDPLAAALAAGETPSPQMVAASTKRGTLRPLQAALLVAWIVAALAAIVLLSDRALHRYVRMPLSFELLRARASEIAAEAGYEAQPADRASEIARDDAAVHYVDGLPQPDGWERFRRAPMPAVYFWDRGSPVPLVRDGDWRVLPRNPPNAVAGMTLLELDMEGQLLLFEGVPPQVDRTVVGVRPMEWSRFFDRAGLTMRSFRPVAPQWTPPHHSDARQAWIGVHPLRPETPLRVEAASYRGKPVWFEVIFPWQKPDREPSRTAETDPFSLSLLVLYFGAMALAALLAWKNIRLGRGDRRGTFRLVLFIFAARILYWIASGHHVMAMEQVFLFVNALASALYWAALLGLMYLALEPFVRRRWPEGLISWSRLLAGDVRDPLVGRDVIIGGAAGLAAILANHLHPFRGPVPGSPLLYEFGLRGAKGYLPLLLNQIAGSILFTLIVFSIVLFLAMITRRNAIAFGVSWLLLYLVLNLNYGDGTPLGYAISLLFPTILIGVLWRYGMLAMISFFFYLHFSSLFALTTELSAWYATPFLLQFALLTLIALFAFRTSLAGQRLVRVFDE
jgi:predicted Ser/Thr protein kinase